MVSPYDGPMGIFEDFAEEECIVCGGRVEYNDCNICNACAVSDSVIFVDYDISDDEFVDIEDDDEYLTEYGRNY